MKQILVATLCSAPTTARGRVRCAVTISNKDHKQESHSQGSHKKQKGCKDAKEKKKTQELKGGQESIGSKGPKRLQTMIKLQGPHGARTTTYRFCTIRVGNTDQS